MDPDDQDIQFVRYVPALQQEPVEQDDDIQVIEVIGAPRVVAEEMQQQKQQYPQQHNSRYQVVQGQEEQVDQADLPLLPDTQQTEDNDQLLEEANGEMIKKGPYFSSEQKIGQRY